MTSQQPIPQEGSLSAQFKYQQKLRNDSVGEVFRALSLKGETVALLELYPHFKHVQAEALERLRRAVTQAKTIEQPNIAHVINFQLDHSYRLVVVMKFVEGDTLRTWLANQARGVDVLTVARIVAHLAKALQYILDNGLTSVHPVIDPDKIVMTRHDNQPVLVDLGFLEALMGWSNAENGRGQEDVYALGLLFFDLLRGFFPAQYGASHLRFTEQSQVEGEVAKLVESWPAMAPATADILQRALAIDSAQRFASPGELGVELDQLVKGSLSEIALPTIVPTTEPEEKATGPGTKTGDRLVFRQWRSETDKEGEESHYTIRKEVTTIGGSNSDFLLKAEIGSQRLILLRHERGYGRYYTITDAANGADRRQPIYLDEIPLASDYATLLIEGAVVRIGRHRLWLELDADQRSAQLQRVAAPAEGLGLATTEFSVAPNDLLAIPITVRNTTSEVGRLGIVLHGAPDTWVVNRVESRRLNADETEQLTMHVKLPAVAVASARAYPLIVRAISRVLDAQVAAASITVVVRPVDDVTVALEPESLRTGRQGNVQILNRGNYARAIQVRWQERADALVFEPAEAVVSAPPGEPVQVGFRAYVREPRWFGLEKRHAINVLVAPQDGGLARTLPGEVLSRALIPGWLPPLVALALLLALFISTFLLQPEFAAHAVMVAGTPVQGQPVAARDMKLTWTPINSCFYSVYKDGMALKWLIWHWNDDQASIEILDEAPGVYEVRLRGCLLLGEKSWQVAIASPPPATPPPTPLPVITRFKVTPTDLLLGEQGDICFSWEIGGRAPDLRIVPNIGAVSPELGETCLPIAEVARSEGEVSYTLVATFGEQQVASPAVKVTARRAFCTQNTEIPLYIREGPGTQYPERGQLMPDARVYPIARPFMPQEQTVPERWLQVLVSLDDPRPAWVALNYLSCPDLTSLPVSNLIPPTPTPTPTLTPTPTPTPTPVLTPMAEVAPEIIREGDCTMLRWDIQGVDKVFLNDVGIVGVGEQEICDPPRGTHIFTWKIIQRDGNIVELTRRLLVNAAQP
ncbi:MAG TPA: hypothetical protein GYA08_24530 [Chloroflexi bacterium]|nr:hypothetical protein [Chloroflexota bacterium]